LNFFVSSVEWFVTSWRLDFVCNLFLSGVSGNNIDLIGIGISRIIGEVASFYRSWINGLAVVTLGRQARVVGKEKIYDTMHTMRVIVFLSLLAL